MYNRHFYNLLIILILLSLFALACTISSPWQQPNSAPSATPAPTASDEDEKLKEKIAELEKKVEEQQKQKVPPPVVKQTVPIIKSSGTYARVSSPNDGFLALRSEPNSELGYRILQIPHGATVQVLSCQNFSQSIGGRRGRWCRISYDGYTGWAFDGWLVY